MEVVQQHEEMLTKITLGVEGENPVFHQMRKKSHKDLAVLEGGVLGTGLALSTLVWTWRTGTVIYIRTDRGLFMISSYSHCLVVST